MTRLRSELRRREEEIELLRATVASQQRMLTTIDGTLAWQLLQRFWRTRDRVLARSDLLRRAYDGGFGALKRWVRRMPRVAGAPRVDQAEAYALWVQRHTPGDGDLASMRTAVAGMPERPLLSVITPVHEIPEPLLRRCIESVRRQVWDRWELLLVDDGSRAEHVSRVLAEVAAADPRIRVDRLPENGGIVAATSRGLALAQGEFVTFLDHDDELAPEALYEVALKFRQDPELDLVYSDEDKLDAQGRRVEPLFKPDWSPDLLLSMNYVCHLAAYRRSLLEEVGGLRAGFDGSQDYDLVLRFTERARKVAHVPKVLYHWRKVQGSDAAARGTKLYAHEAALRALQDALERRRTGGRVEEVYTGVYRVRYAVRGKPLVSIVMPTKDKAAVLRKCVESIERRSSWSRYELILVDNGSTDPEALEYLEVASRRHRVLRYDRPFNWSAINNWAAPQARGEQILFMNNDMEVMSADWMEALLEQAQRPEVGAAGARLLYPNGSVQHAGVVIGLGSVAGHAFKDLPGADPSYAYLAHAIRDVSAVTGACLMVRREVFGEVGGFDEGLRVAFNDVDFCLKLRRRGYLVVYTPAATLYHHESTTRGASHPPEDEELMKVRWHGVLESDPYYSPHLTREREDYGIAT